MSTVRQQLQTTVPRSPRTDAPSPRDVQRDALRDLVALATECAATEARIEQQFNSSTEQARKDYDKLGRAVTARFAALREEVRQKHEARTNDIQAKFAAEREGLKESHLEAREKIERDHEPMERKSQEKLSQAIWLADSVLEVAQNQVREETKKLREALDAHDEALAEVENRAQSLLRNYNQWPPPADLDPSPSLAIEDPQAEMAAQLDAANARLKRLRGLVLPRLFVGAWPWLALVVLLVAAAVAGQFAGGPPVPNLYSMGMAVCGTLLVAVTLGIILRLFGRKQVREAYVPLRRAVEAGRKAAKAHADREGKRHDAMYAEALQKRNAEVQRLRERAAPVLSGLIQKRQNALNAADVDFEEKLGQLEENRDYNARFNDDWQARHSEELNQQEQAELRAAKEKFEFQTRDSRQQYEDGRVALERRLRDGLAHIQAPVDQRRDANGQVPHDWADAYWNTWAPPQKFPALVRFGQMQVDLKLIADQSKQNGQMKLQLPATFKVPAALSFPRGASLLIEHDRSGRQQAIRILQTVMSRLLTSLPAGRARFTIIDPVGLGQNFAGFMHLADHDEALVGTRIWTETDQIEQRLADMTEHMETVIQKYLRNEFATIDDYNAQAGELAEPYRFLVVADFPTGFQGEAFRRLASIAATGARCGVYILVARDTRALLPPEAQLDDLQHHSVHLAQKGDTFVWKDDVFGQFPLALDAPPPEDVLTKLLDRVGAAAKESKRVEVPFDTIAPSQSELWTGDSTDDLQVPIGRMGATRLQNLRLGRGVAQHVLIAGKTGSGKSTLLHALVTNLAMWYSPDQVELYLIDFKKGVEFKTYATHNLPHARAIAVESDREFGVSVLQRLDAELARRGELFRKAGVQDLASYRKTQGALVMPRTLLVIDEFQEFFSEDDRLAQDAGLLLDRLVRQGRAFGIHVLLGSQTIGGTSGLARSTIGQMAVRIALQTSEADSQLILGDNNSAARLLSRPGEAIYNDAGGLVEANSPFQVAWLPDERREVYLDRVLKREAANGNGHPAAIVFEGNAPADVRKNSRLLTLLGSKAPAAAPAAGHAWIGEPVAIKDPTAINFRRQSGSNVLLVGQQEEQALAVMSASMISLAAQYPTNAARFFVLDGTPADSALAGTFERVKAALPHETTLIEWRAVAEAIAKLADEIARRQGAEPAGQPEIFLLIYGLQRYRILRKSDDDFSFSMSSDESKKPNPARQFADLLRDGPALGIHVVTWVDTVASIERTLDRTSLREFDHRILFQMSANDSSTLVDSPAANKLGFYRALAYSEEQGVMEKFRPYALPDAAWLRDVAKALTGR